MRPLLGFISALIIFPLSGCFDKTQPSEKDGSLDEQILSISRTQINSSSDNKYIKDLNNSLSVPFVELSIKCSKEHLNDLTTEEKRNLKLVMQKVVDGEALTPSDKDISIKWTGLIQPCINKAITEHKK